MTATAPACLARVLVSSSPKTVITSIGGRSETPLKLSMAWLVYSTSSAQMREVLAGLERALRAHPKISSGAVVARFSALGPSSLDIEIMAWFETQDWGEFQLIRENLLLQFMEIVERAGTSLAFPTRTVHMVTEKS